MVSLISRTKTDTTRRLRLSAIFTCFIFFSIFFLYRREIFGMSKHKKLSYSYKAIYNYIAMIVDDRATPALENAVINVLQHIPVDWKIQIVTPHKNWLFYQQSTIAQLIQSGRVFLTPLEAQRNSLHSADFINLVLTSSSFWYQVQGDKVLLFQTDSVLCSNSAYNLTHFLDYDFVGAPWASGGCCNGGLSLRSRTKMLEMLESSGIRYSLGDINEDGWFTKNLRHVNARIAPLEVATAFAVETVYQSRPFGIHNPHLSKIGRENMQNLCNECPEAKTLFSLCQSSIVAGK